MAGSGAGCPRRGLRAGAGVGGGHGVVHARRRTSRLPGAARRARGPRRGAAGRGPAPSAARSPAGGAPRRRRGPPGVAGRAVGGLLVVAVLAAAVWLRPYAAEPVAVAAATPSATVD